MTNVCFDNGIKALHCDLSHIISVLIQRFCIKRTSVIKYEILKGLSVLNYTDYSRKYSSCENK